MACLSVRPKCGELEINDNACEKVVLCHKVYSHLDICLHRMSSLFYLVDKKATTRNRYNRIPQPTLNTKRERDTYN